ncbi:MAG: hypothetical protein L3J37_00340 [Rhodobacteraceae bacterium]|nr:hypothetical protein [Paracoccaceae bacterium]
MASLFSGMATILGGIFGDTVTITPNGQPPREIQGILREEPLEVLDQEGVSVSTVSIWLKAQRLDVADLRRGDLIVALSGIQYRYVSKLPSGSPAEDAFVTISLEKA